MKPVRIANAATGRRPGRDGTTLTEVLMALLVMGLGLVSVATLFPLSLLRSVEATKLTNATLARINAEARINASVGVDTFGNAIGRAIVEDPDDDGDVREHDATKFVFDPLGANVFASDGTQYGNGFSMATSFGGKDANGDGVLDAPAGIERHNFSIVGRPAAEAFVSLPDSFVSLADVFGGAVKVSGASMDLEGIDLSEYVQTPPLALRVTVLHADGRQSAVREAAEVVDKDTIDLKVALPGSYAGNVARVTVETRESRYTWIATVRRFGLKPSVTIAVFFRRSFDPADEKIWAVREPPGGYNEFEFDTTADALGDLVRPPGMRVGGYMFDAATFRWLKIATIDEVKSADPPFLRFTTDPEDIDPSPRPRAVVPAMFPNNVVEAYTLKKN